LFSYAIDRLVHQTSTVLFTSANQLIELDRINSYTGHTCVAKFLGDLGIAVHWLTFRYHKVISI